MTRHYGDPQSLCPTRAILGEGPVWIVGDAALWFVDIEGLRLYRFDPVSGARREWSTPSKPGWVLPVDDGGLMVGLTDGLHRFDPFSGSFEFVAAPDLAPGDRLNDATVGLDGVLWFGTMDDACEARTGRVYRFSGRSVQGVATEPAAIVNGPALSPDGRTLYHVNTLAREVFAHELRPDGSLGSATLFAKIEAEDGYPDGPSVDAEGHVWIGLYAGWAAHRYAPDGRLSDVVRFPVAHVTKIAFGGGDLCTAYVTTARQQLTPQQLIEQPLAGNVFAFHCATPGLPTPAIRWKGMS